MWRQDKRRIVARNKTTQCPGTSPSRRWGINRFSWLFSPYYDKITHNCLRTSTYSTSVFCFFEFLDCYEHQYSRLHVIAVIVLITAVFMIAWECVGYSIDLLVQSSCNNGLYDTIGDLIANLIGIGIRPPHHPIPSVKNSLWKRYLLASYRG